MLPSCFKHGFAFVFVHSCKRPLFGADKRDDLFLDQSFAAFGKANLLVFTVFGSGHQSDKSLFFQYLQR